MGAGGKSHRKCVRGPSTQEGDHYVSLRLTQLGSGQALLFAVSVTLGKSFCSAPLKIQATKEGHVRMKCTNTCEQLGAWHMKMLQCELLFLKRKS